MYSIFILFFSVAFIAEFTRWERYIGKIYLAYIVEYTVYFVCVISYTASKYEEKALGIGFYLLNFYLFYALGFMTIFAFSIRKLEETFE